jgi:DNA-binding ferritin-like protein (Dps family)
LKDLIIQKDDIKTGKWSMSFKKEGINLIPQKGSAIKAPFFLVYYILKTQNRPNGYIVRYLNDYPGLGKTLLRFFSEIFLIFLSRILNIRLFWICHNVDKESEAYFPSLSERRRNLFARNSEIIFVTDQLLIDKAKEVFPKHQHKIDFITFGVIENDRKDEIKPFEKEILKLINNRREYTELNGYRFKVVFCAGMPKSEKSLHFDFLLELIEMAKLNGIYLQAIVSGDFKNSERGNYLLKSYSGHEHIYLFDRYTQFSKEFVNKAVDYYWRGYSDYSVPYTVYEAATHKKPILALNNGFFRKFIKFYKLGESIDLNTGNFSEVIDEIEQDKFLYDEFLETHKWDVFAKKISNFFKNSRV